MSRVFTIEDFEPTHTAYMEECDFIFKLNDVIDNGDSITFKYVMTCEVTDSRAYDHVVESINEEIDYIESIRSASVDISGGKTIYKLVITIKKNDNDTFKFNYVEDINRITDYSVEEDETIGPEYSINARRIDDYEDDNEDDYYDAISNIEESFLDCAEPEYSDFNINDLDFDEPPTEFKPFEQFIIESRH